MSKKFKTIYLAVAPVLFGLSWFISNRLFEQFMSDKGTVDHPVTNHSFAFASSFTLVYIIIFFVILDLYPTKKTA
ncbi:MAG: hypothetical protein ACK5EW_00405 [Bacteroidota bacterium]|jgi:hypothetical protein